MRAIEKSKSDRVVAGRFSAELFKLIEQEGRAQRPPARPGPMLVEIARRYFEAKEGNHER